MKATLEEMKARNEKRFGWKEIKSEQFNVYKHGQYSEIRYDAQASNGHWYRAERCPGAVPKGAIVLEARSAFVVAVLDGIECKFSSLAQAKRFATLYGCKVLTINGIGYTRESKWTAEEVDLDTVDFAMM